MRVSDESAAPNRGAERVESRAEASCSKLMEVVLEPMVNHLEQASAFRRACHLFCIVSALFLLYFCHVGLQYRPDRSWEPPRASNSAQDASESAPRAIQEAAGSHYAVKLR